MPVSTTVCTQADHGVLTQLKKQQRHSVSSLTTRYVFSYWRGRTFVEYLNTFLKLKQEASGYPSWVRTPDDEDKFIRQFYQSEGIQLDKDSIRYNASKRGLSKLCLNSMWGKLTERSNRSQTKLISEPHELYRFLVTPGI